jgi:hypothetical protein
MGMSWNLKISNENGCYISTIEINGQQTSMLVQAKVIGGMDKITLTFDKGLKGFGFENLREGDKLFELRVKNNQIITKWEKMTPRLTVKFKNDTISFMKNK